MGIPAFCLYPPLLFNYIYYTTRLWANLCVHVLLSISIEVIMLLDIPNLNAWHKRMCLGLPDTYILRHNIKINIICVFQTVVGKKVCELQIFSLAGLGIR